MRTFVELWPERSVETPVVVEVPHAGLAMPESVRELSQVPRDAVLRDSDLYVDHIWSSAPEAGASLLASLISRYVVDLNRAVDDVDSASVVDHKGQQTTTQSRGVLWRITTDGRPALRRPLRSHELAERLRTFHEPYHRALREILEVKKARFGYAILLAAHSMPSSSRDGTARRADVVPGTRGGTTAHPTVLEAIEKHFRAAGLSVRHDDPYRGGFTTGHYGHPEQGVHAVQIELNRSVYADEITCRPKDRELAWLRGLATSLVRRLGALPL